MNSFESYIDVDHRKLGSQTRQTRQTRQTSQTRRTCQTCLPRQTVSVPRTGILHKISAFAVGMVIGWMAGTITYCTIHIFFK